MIFLQILGILFLIILLIAGYLGLRIYNSMKKSTGVGKDFSTLLSILPPLRLELDKSSVQRWEKQAILTQDENLLKSLEFNHAGYFTSTIGSMMVKISLWSLNAQGIIVVLTEAKSTGADSRPISYIKDVFVEFGKSGTLTLTNTTDFDCLPRPPQHQIHHIDTHDLQKMLNQLTSKISPGTKIKPVQSPVSHFKDYFDELSEWVWQKEQLCSNKLRDTLQPIDITIEGDLLRQLLDHAAYQMNEIYSEKIKLQYTKTEKLTATQWEELRDQLIIVHEKMRATELIDAFYHLVGEDLTSDIEHLMDEIEDKQELDDPLVEFSNLLKKIPQFNEVQPLDNVSDPIKADIYKS